MNSRPSLVLTSLCVSVGLSLVACGGGGFSAADGDVARGKAAIEKRACQDCHEPNLSGSPGKLDQSKLTYPSTIAYSSNLTSEKETGLGNWTDDEIARAMREGYQKDGHIMCEPMPIYKDMTDQEVADIIAFLRTLPPIKKRVIDSQCPDMPKM